MKSILHWKRSRFDELLSSPGKLWIARGTILFLLAAAGLEAWTASTSMVARLDGAQLQARQFIQLEDSVENLRTQASTVRLDSARADAFHCAFSSWENLADWLEDLRLGARREGWSLEWQLADSKLPQAFPGVHRQLVVLHLVLPDADFWEAQKFLRLSMESDVRQRALLRLEGTGDRQGITNLRWTLVVWVRPRHA